MSGEDLSADLGVVELFHRAMNVDDDAGRTIDEGGGFDPLEEVADAVAVVAAHGAPFERGRIDRLNLTEVVEGD